MIRNTMNVTSKVGKLFFLAFVVLITVNHQHTRAQTVFDFESLPVPASGFNNGDPSLNATERLFFGNVAQTNFAPGSNFGVMSQVDQTLTVSANGESLDFPNSFFETEPNAGFAAFFTGFSYSNVVDTSTAGLGNQYAAFPGSGSNGSSNYLISTGETSFTASRVIQSIDIAPTTFTALAILDGDDGGNNFVSGPLSSNAGFFELIISGGSSGIEIPVSFGDFRDPTNVTDVPTTFQTIDVSSLNATTLSFRYDGSDTSFGFLNTPTFFAADNIVVAAVPEPSSFVILLSIGGLAATCRRRSAI